MDGAPRRGGRQKTLPMPWPPFLATAFSGPLCRPERAIRTGASQNKIKLDAACDSGLRPTRWMMLRGEVMAANRPMPWPAFLATTLRPLMSAGKSNPHGCFTEQNRTRCSLRYRPQADAMVGAPRKGEGRRTLLMPWPAFQATTYGPLCRPKRAIHTGASQNKIELDAAYDTDLSPTRWLVLHSRSMA